LERSNTLIVTYRGEPVKVAVRSYVVDPAARLFQLNAGQLQLIVVRSRLATGPGAYRKRTSVTPAAPAPGRNAGMPSSRCCQGAPAIYSPALARGRVIADRCTPDQGCTDPRSWPPPGGATSAVPPAPSRRPRPAGAGPAGPGHRLPSAPPAGGRADPQSRAPSRPRHPMRAPVPGTTRVIACAPGQHERGTHAAERDCRPGIRSHGSALETLRHHRQRRAL